MLDSFNPPILQIVTVHTTVDLISKYRNIVPETSGTYFSNKERYLKVKSKIKK